MVPAAPRTRIEWRQVDRGPRPSTTLQVAAALTAVAAILPMLPAGTITTAATWWVWDLALVATCVALILGASHPWLTRFGYVAGCFHLAQAAALTFVLAGARGAAVVYHVLAAPKYLTLVVFTFTERRNLRLPRRLPLMIAAAIAAVKSLLVDRPAATSLAVMIADRAMLLLLAWSFALVAATLHRHEDAWAERKLRSHAADVADFNNPTTKRAPEIMPVDPRES